jgi:dTMP kinase
MLVAIEGIDGSGKGTQAEFLASSLRRSGFRVHLLGFPRYTETAFGRWVGEFLNGRFGALDQVHPLLVSLLFAGDRFESRPVLREALATNDFVILDRYVASNIAHQAAKADGDERRELCDWIEQLEFGLYELPRPDLVILLDLPVQQAQRLIARKTRRIYTDKPADLQEADGGYLDRVREMYLQLASADPAWHTVAVMRDDQVRTVDDVATEVESTVRAALGSAV